MADTRGSPGPTGEARPNSSSINTDTVGQTVANMVTARLGAGGLISIYSYTGTDVIGTAIRAMSRRESSRYKSELRTPSTAILSMFTVTPRSS